MILELVERDKCLCMGEFRRGINLAKYVVCGDEKNCKMYGECQQGKEKRMCPKKYILYRHKNLSWHCVTKEKKKVVEKNRLKQLTN